MTFLCPEVALYLYKSNIEPYMKYSCHVWVGASSCYLELLDKLHMQNCWPFTRCFSWTLGSSWKCSQLRSSVGINFEDVHMNWLNWFHFVILEGGLLVTLYKLHDFSVSIHICYKDVYANSFFPSTASLRNFLPIEWFPLIYDLNGFKSRFNRHFLTLGSL